MKRTKNIQLEAFRKTWHRYRITPLALAISVTFMLTACEKSDENVSLYQNASDCTHVNPSMAEECSTAYNNALVEAEKTAPKYASREDCAAEFGESQCITTPKQAGIAADTQNSTSTWMPLMAGYMMGRMMGGAGFAQQPLFTSKNTASPVSGKFVDATGKSYGPATAGGRTITVPRTAMAPKPTVTRTITRGGFGESVVKQANMQRANAAPNTRSRSMGG